MSIRLGQHAASQTGSRSRPRMAIAALAMGLGFVLIAPTAQAATSPTASGPVNPAPPRTSATLPPKHLYPSVPVAQADRQAATPNPSNVLYRGGSVVTGKPRVYLVFWGSQWGTGSAQTGFSQDAPGVAPRLVKLFQGIGARVPDGNANTTDPYEQFSNTNTWYCRGIALNTDGTNPSTGCAHQSAANHVGYPTGGALAGIYNDTATAAPSTATTAQLAAEADRAAAHFGNTQANAQYIIASPHNTHPDGFFGGNWCAWHSYSSAAHPVAYTNLPYLPDAGGSCGAGFVNGGSGALDGVTIVAGHEYSETVTDPTFGGWWDRSGEETSDKCAWIRGSSDPKANSQNVKLSTGTFPLQSNWLNSAVQGNVIGACRISAK